MSLRREIPVSKAGLEMAKWAPGETAGTRPPCTSVAPAERGSWTSDNPDAKALARRECLNNCPLAVRMQCLKRALDSGCEDGVYGGHFFSGISGRRLARQEMERYLSGKQVVS